MTTPASDRLTATRRYFLGQGSGLTLGAMALAGMSSSTAEAAPARLDDTGGLLGLPHFAAKAKRVIFLTQSGGPSQIELYDEKPGLEQWAGKELPESVRQGQRLTLMTAQQQQLVMPSKTRFHRCGESGATVSEWLPHIGSVADDVCFIKSIFSEHINHAPAMTFLLTGHQIPGRPSIGAWASYGLGSFNRNLPDFVVLVSKMERPSDQPLYDYYWGSGFLPSRYQGVKFRNTGEPVPYLANPPGVSRAARRALLDDLAAMNARHLADYGDPEIDTRIASYEMAFRMQTSVPELVDFSDEPQHVLDRYGPDVHIKGSFAFNCLVARRLLERGTRFVQLMHAGWDQHGNLFSQLEIQCRDTQRPSAALVQDLKDRGLLDDTLVAWGGEFGRTPFGQGDPANPKGRDHFGKAFSWWLAGGGVKPGHVHGATDDYAWNIVADPVHVHDMQATIMHLLGIDHTRLNFRYQGRQFRLTDVHGHVVNGMLA